MDNNTFFKLRETVAGDIRLSIGERFILSEIISLARSKKGIECWAPNSFFAERFKIHEKSVARMIASFVKLNYISTKIFHESGSKSCRKRLIAININLEASNREATNSSVTSLPEASNPSVPKQVTQTAQASNPSVTTIYKVKNTKRILNKNTEGRDVVKEVFEHWKKRMNHQRAVLDGSRKRKIESALKNYSQDELINAIDGCAKSAWHMGQNDRKMVYDKIDLIFRNSEFIEKFIGYCSNPPINKKKWSYTESMARLTEEDELELDFFRTANQLNNNLLISEKGNE